MGWEHQIAQSIKDSGDRAKNAAIEEGSAYLGTIERTSPLKISIMGGEGMYEGEEIAQSRLFAEYSASLKKPGTQVIVVPIDSVDTIAVLDIVKGG